eukprot:gnl/TRDRNA2_/TRDRNA2_168162_c1_seq3.p1 gnl/TRDRNA2_/TRDRNA2_168162_c1~~gnl/TRDRNA2_/TRDRNA2_168162_c1_seq3.p1  ORF type:complete len:302 (+),score=51.03 gnl/TRDRNA2_/TRDRNA2_168162_c1_seq3:88-993(+)
MGTFSQSLSSLESRGIKCLLVAAAVRCISAANFRGAEDAGPPYAVLPTKLSAAGFESSFELLDGEIMPIFGMGLYMSEPGTEARNAVKWALELGYRMIDTARIYGNEADVGEAISEAGVPRSEIFITTKLSPRSHGYAATLNAVKTSLEKMGLNYLDLFIIHSPSGGKIVETWDAMVEAQRQGMIRSIGVSNFGIPHLEALVAHKRPLPTVNQIEMHPLVYEERRELLDWCKKRGILTQAYGSMFSGQERALSNAVLESVVAEYPGKTSQQVLLRWGLQMGFQVIPKSVKKSTDRGKHADF